MTNENIKTVQNEKDINPQDFEKSYLALALGTKEFIYPDIDIIYKQSSLEYYELYKESSLSKLQCFKTLSSLQEEYIRKVIGIIELCDKCNDNKLILTLIKKGYNVVFRYCTSHETLSVSEVLDLYIKQTPNPTVLEIQNLTSVVVYLYDIGYGMHWNNNDEINEITTESYLNFVHLSIRKDIDHYINRHISLDQVSKVKDKYFLNGKKIKLNRALGKIREYEAQKLGFGEDIDVSDVADVNYKRKQLATQGISKYYCAFERFLYANDFHPFFLDNLEFSDEEINYLIENCVGNQRYFKINDSEMDMYIISSLFLAMVIKEYRNTRDLYLDKSKEDLFLSLKKQKEDLGKQQQALEKQEKLLSDENFKLKQKNEQFKKEINELNLQIKKLNNTLKEKEDKEKELQSLREMLFKLEFSDDPFILNINIDNMIQALSKEKIVFVSGQVALLNKLKEVLPNIRCLDIDKLGADISFIDNYSSIFVDVNHLSHSFYYKLTARINKNKSKLCYITKKTNIELIINEMYEFLFTNHI
jgi:hypothetical protein